MNAIIDIGNSRIKIGLFRHRLLVERLTFLHEQIDEVSALLAERKVTRLITSSTAEPSLMPQIEEDVEHIILSPETAVPITLDYHHGTLGMDRLADAVALVRLHSPTGLVIDMGTCVTYNILVEGVFIGGGISPGHRMRLKAMNAFTGRLPLVDSEGTPPILPDNTTDALRSGAFYGLAYEIEGHISAFRTIHPEGHVIMTGGDAERFASALKKTIFVDPLLTLRGLNEILLHHYED